MDQENNNNIITNAAGVRLKKVKRPVRRLMPEDAPTPGQNMAQSTSNPFTTQQNLQNDVSENSQDFEHDGGVSSGIRLRNSSRGGRKFQNAF